MTQNTKGRVEEITEVILAERFDMQHLSAWADGCDPAARVIRARVKGAGL